jgi:hypothetical protein
MQKLPKIRAPRKRTALRPSDFAALVRSIELRGAPLPVRRIAMRFGLPIHRAAVVAALAGVGSGAAVSP